MSPTLEIVLLWLLFSATHMGLSSLRVRPLLAEKLGERGFLGVYSLVAFAVFIPLVGCYWGHRHEGELLWAVGVGPGLLWTLYVLWGVSVTLMVLGLIQQSPASMMAPGGGASPRGVLRLTRHPLFMGLALLAALHLIVNGFATDVAFFGGLAAYSVIGCLHQDRRKLVSDGDTYRAWYDATPFFPFTGRGTLQGLRELPIPGVVGGIALTVAIRWIHHL